VALQAALGVAVSLLIAGKVPDDQGLVAGTGQEHVGAKGRNQKSAVKLDAKICSSWLLLLQRGGEGGNPAIVALEGAAKNQLLSHDGSETMKEKGLAE
jgi:hypothetical protein